MRYPSLSPPLCTFATAEKPKDKKGDDDAAGSTGNDGTYDSFSGYQERLFSNSPYDQVCSIIVDVVLLSHHSNFMPLILLLMVLCNHK